MPKISELSSGTVALMTDEAPVARSGATLKVSPIPFGGVSLAFRSDWQPCTAWGNDYTFTIDPALPISLTAYTKVLFSVEVASSSYPPVVDVYIVTDGKILPLSRDYSFETFTLRANDSLSAIVDPTTGDLFSSPSDRGGTWSIEMVGSTTDGELDFTVNPTAPSGSPVVSPTFAFRLTVTLFP